MNFGPQQHGPIRVHHREKNIIRIEASGDRSAVARQMVQTVAGPNFPLQLQLKPRHTQDAFNGVPRLKPQEVGKLEENHRSNCASNAIALGLKSIRFTYAAASVAPCSRSIRESSHSTLSGP